MSTNPRDVERNPDYYAARQALAQHLHRHHDGAAGVGTLGERLDQHDDLHWQCGQRLISLSHTHAEPDGYEEPLATAHRYLAEGEAGRGKTNQ